MKRENSDRWAEITAVAEQEATRLSKYYSAHFSYPLDFRLLFRLLELRHRAHPVSWLQTGGLIHLDSSSPSILYSALDSRARIRFTIAHEIGHWIVFNNGDLKNLLGQATTESFNAEEIFCDQFASSLLMPRWDFSKRFVEFTNIPKFLDPASSKPEDVPSCTIIEQLCSDFGVSAEACIFQLQRLGLFKRSRSIAFCAKIRSSKTKSAQFKFRIATAAYDRDSFFVPKNCGLLDIGWRGQPDKDLDSYFKSQIMEEVLDIKYRDKVAQSFKSKKFVCLGDYLTYGQSKRIIIGLYTILHSK